MLQAKRITFLGFIVVLTTTMVGAKHSAMTVLDMDDLDKYALLSNCSGKGTHIALLEPCKTLQSTDTQAAVERDARHLSEILTLEIAHQHSSHNHHAHSHASVLQYAES